MMTAPLPKLPQVSNVPPPGDEPRRWYRYRRRGRLTCPDGHHLPNVQRIPESGFLRCAHWIGAERRECGRWIYILAIRGGGSVVVEVALTELDDLEHCSTPAEVIEYLGIMDEDGHRAHVPVDAAAASHVPSHAAHPSAGPPRRDHRGR